MKRYQDIQGDGGSDVVGQVEAQGRAIAAALSGVRHRVAVASGKGGVGKSTLTMALARSLRREGRRVAILDADLNGPSQARLAGLEGAPWIPGDAGLRLPHNADGIGVASMGSLLGEASPLGFESVARGDEQTWRATREFALLAQLLGAVEWGELDVLLVDLPPGTERTSQFAHFLGQGTAFVLVTLPSAISRGVVARSVSELTAHDRRLVGYVENMAGYYCRRCDEVRPLFPAAETELEIPCLGRIPFDPELAALCDRGFGPDGPDDEVPRSRALDAVGEVAARIWRTLDENEHDLSEPEETTT